MSSPEHVFTASERPAFLFSLLAQDLAQVYFSILPACRAFGVVMSDREE